MKAEPRRAGTIAVLDVGCLARARLREGARFEVTRVFERSFYVAAPGGPWVCILARSAGGDPLAVRCRARHRNPWAGRGVARGTRARMQAGRLEFDNGLVLALSGAATWHPRPIPPHSPSALELGLARFERLVQAGMRGDSLGLLRPCTGRASEQALARRACRAVDPLVAWVGALRRGNRPPAPALEPLLGLGPGLTPAGDDFLCGVLVTLRALGAREAALDLYRRLCGHLRRCGEWHANPVSAGYLRAAARGLAGEPLHRALNALLAGERETLSTALAGLDAVGHSSGWDALAGVALTLRAWSHAAPVTRFGAGR